MDAQQRYARIGLLIQQMPNLHEQKLKPDALDWLAKAFALVRDVVDASDVVQFKTLSNSLVSQGDSRIEAHLLMIVRRALAIAELEAPLASSGGFLAAGSTFDALVEVGKVLKSARHTIRIVDPYLDDNALTEFAVLAAAGIRMEFLADRAGVKPGFEPALARFRAQYGEERPVEGRLTAAKALHDRLIFVDGQTVWMVSQSLNGIAVRSPASIVRLDAEMADLKVAAYAELWDRATSILE